MSAKALATRKRILDAASELFKHQGFAVTGVRAIASKAGVDPTLIARYFGSKEALFLETLNRSSRLGEMYAGPLESLGERIVRGLLAVDPSRPDNVLPMSLIRASESRAVRERLAASITDQMVTPLIPLLPPVEAEIRARVFAAAVLGLIHVLFIAEAQDFRDVPEDRFVAYYGEMLQRALTGPPPQ
jgi:AcrR family transcriptional regulator